MKRTILIICLLLAVSGCEGYFNNPGTGIILNDYFRQQRRLDYLQQQQMRDAYHNYNVRQSTFWQEMQAQRDYINP